MSITDTQADGHLADFDLATRGGAVFGPTRRRRSPWKHSKRGSIYRRLNGLLLSVFEGGGGWRWRVACADGYAPEFSPRSNPTPQGAAQEALKAAQRRMDVGGAL